MNRREFLGLGAMASIFPAHELLGGALTSDGMPTWARQEIASAVSRFKSWKGNDKVVSFVFMTDLHSHLEVWPAKPDYADSRFHTRFAFEAARQAGCDFLVDGGDHDYDNVPRDVALRRMAVAERSYQDYVEKPVLFCLGNHDHGKADAEGIKPISSELFGNTFNGLTVKHGFKLVFGENRSWGYYDVVEKGFRMIFCNTSDSDYEGLSGSQIGFVKNSLDSLPEGWCAGLVGHYCIFDEIGHWKQYVRGYRKWKSDFMAVLELFAKRRPNDLVGYFCGDSHYDNQQEYHGVNWTISQGYGGIDELNLPYGARYLGSVKRSKEMLFEIVGVKPLVGEFRLFRVGKGGAVCDRVCRYWNKGLVK